MRHEKGHSSPRGMLVFDLLVLKVHVPKVKRCREPTFICNNAEITLEILEVLHYKSLSFGNPTTRELQISLCERKGQ